MSLIRIAQNSQQWVLEIFDLCHESIRHTISRPINKSIPQCRIENDMLILITHHNNEYIDLDTGSTINITKPGYKSTNYQTLVNDWVVDFPFSVNQTQTSAFRIDETKQMFISCHEQVAMASRIPDIINDVFGTFVCFKVITNTSRRPVTEIAPRIITVMTNNTVIYEPKASFIIPNDHCSSKLPSGSHLFVGMHTITLWDPLSILPPRVYPIPAIAGSKYSLHSAIAAPTTIKQQRQLTMIVGDIPLLPELHTMILKYLLF